MLSGVAAFPEDLMDRIKFEVRYRTAEGVYKLRASVTPGSQTARQVLAHMEYLERRARQYEVSTKETVLLMPEQTVSV